MKNNKQITVVDWLQVHYNAEIPTFKTKSYFNLNKDCFIRYTNTGTKNFLNNDDLFLNGNKIATIQHNPRTTVIKENTIILQLENELFYSGSFVYLFDYITDVLGWKKIGTTKIEIANDSVNDSYDFVSNLLLKINTNKTTNIKHSGKANITKEISKYLNKSTIYIGSKKSDKCCKLYGKSDELKQNNKRYIKTFYRNNGLDYRTNEITRFELTLKDKLAKSIDLRRLDDVNYLNDILNKECKKFFEFKKVVIRKGKKKTIDVTPLNFKALPTTYNKIQIKQRTEINSVASTKRHIKYLYMNNKEYINTIHLDNTVIINRLLSEYDLHHWYKSKVNQWNKEAEKITAYDLIEQLEAKK